jgi:hypothetical protein
VKGYNFVSGGQFQNDGKKDEPVKKDIYGRLVAGAKAATPSAVVKQRPS